MNKALFLDLDGTVRRCTVEGQPCPNKVGEQELLPNVLDVIKWYKKDGFKIIGVTNQGGVGLGYMSAKDNEAICDELNEMCEGAFDKIYSATAKPSTKHVWTKPNPGMIRKAANDHQIELSKSIMVGDRHSDAVAAMNAGIPYFFWAREFFHWSENK